MSFFTGRGGALEIFQVLEIFSDPPTVWVKFFWSPLMYCRIQVIPPKKKPPPHNKSGQISFCIRSWDWPSLGLVKSEGREFKRNFNSCSSKTRKFASYQYPLHDWQEIWKTTSLHTFIFLLLWETGYNGNRRIFPYLSCLIWYRGNSWLEKQFLCMVARVNKLPWQQDESLYLKYFET